MLGLNAGATGLAIKMVAVQIIGVNVQLWFNARLLGLSFWRYIGHQLVSAGCLLGIAVLAKISIDQGLALQNKIFYNFFLAGVLYTTFVIALAYFQPILFGLKRQDIQFIVKSVTKNFRRV